MIIIPQTNNFPRQPVRAPSVGHPWDILFITQKSVSGSDNKTRTGLIDHVKRPPVILKKIIPALES